MYDSLCCTNCDKIIEIIYNIPSEINGILSKTESPTYQENGENPENHKMINGILLRVDVTRKVSKEENNATIIVEDSADNTEVSTEIYE